MLHIAARLTSQPFLLRLNRLNLIEREPCMNNKSDLSTIVVDDIEAVCSLVAEFVNSLEGISVIGTANSIKDAMDSITHFEPHAVILDVGMPSYEGMRSGMDVLKWIKTHYPITAVIMFSNYSAGQMRKPCLGLGAYAYLDKTMEADLLADVLNQLVKERANNHFANHH